MGSLGAPLERLRAAELGYDLTTPDNYKTAKPIVEVYKSPVSVAWEGGGKSLLFDQESEGLHGSYPGVIVLPVRGRSAGSWGAIVFDMSRQPHKKTLKATKQGEVHILRIDLKTRRAAAYEMRVTRGETYTMRVAPDVIDPGLVRADGTVIRPTLIDLSRDRGHATRGGATSPKATAPPTRAQELELARAAYRAAFEKYTKLATEGDAGDIDQALEEYKEAYQRLKDLEQRSP